MLGGLGLERGEPWLGHRKRLAPFDLGLGEGVAEALGEGPVAPDPSPIQVWVTAVRRPSCRRWSSPCRASAVPMPRRPLRGGTQAHTSPRWALAVVLPTTHA